MIKLIKALNKKYKAYQYKKDLAAYIEKLEAIETSMKFTTVDI